MRKLLAYLIVLFLTIPLIQPVQADGDLYHPNFDNSKAWGGYDETGCPYDQIGYIGQCTWFAWHAFYEYYGCEYKPVFRGHGFACAKEQAQDPNFSLSDTPKPGCVMSYTSPENHVAFVTEVNDDGTFNYWEGNITPPFECESSLEEFLAKKDYAYRTNMSKEALASQGIPNIEFAVPTDEFLKNANWDHEYDAIKDNGSRIKDKSVWRTELELVGMPDLNNMFVYSGNNFELTTYDKLTVKEQIQLKKLQDDMKETESANQHRLINTIISLIGLLTGMYGVLLLIGYYFDKANTFMDISLVTALTLGYIHIEDEYNPSSGQGVVLNKKQLHFMAIGLILLSVAWLSGLIQSVFIKIMSLL